MDVHARLSDALPPELFELIRPLLGRPSDLVELRRKVLAYREALVQAERGGAWPDMDGPLGRACANACEALLDAFPSPTEAQAELLQVACGYFVLAEDDEDDLDSLVGFDDDALVINACARLLGVEDAVIPLVPR